MAGFRVHTWALTKPISSLTWSGLGLVSLGTSTMTTKPSSSAASLSSGTAASTGKAANPPGLTYVQEHIVSTSFWCRRQGPQRENMRTGPPGSSAPLSCRAPQLKREAEA